MEDANSNKFKILDTVANTAAGRPIIGKHQERDKRGMHIDLLSQIPFTLQCTVLRKYRRTASTGTMEYSIILRGQ
jgi:hypothetical protein